MMGLGLTEGCQTNAAGKVGQWMRVIVQPPSAAPPEPVRANPVDLQAAWGIVWEVPVRTSQVRSTNSPWRSGGAMNWVTVRQLKQRGLMLAPRLARQGRFARVC